jgi:hypothetical protein
MTHLAELSSSGNLSSFSGVFRVTLLSEIEAEALKNILGQFSDESQDISVDFRTLSLITSEVKAINNQAAILHGERIKKAQQILKKYRDGAFSAWLIATYGNRQTPYNFLQYYDLYTSLPKNLQPKIDEMPKQAIYTLASREGSLDTKEEIIKNYSGQSKNELLAIIRTTFPLAKDDGRAPNLAEHLILQLKRLSKLLSEQNLTVTHPQKKMVKQLLKEIEHKIDHDE